MLFCVICGLDRDVMKSLLSMIVEQFEDRLVQILLAVAVLSGVLSFFEDDPKVKGGGGWWGWGARGARIWGFVFCFVE